MPVMPDRGKAKKSRPKDDPTGRRTWSYLLVCVIGRLFGR